MRKSIFTPKWNRREVVQGHICCTWDFPNLIYDIYVSLMLCIYDKNLKEISLMGYEEKTKRAVALTIFHFILNKFSIIKGQVSCNT